MIEVSAAVEYDLGHTGLPGALGNRLSNDDRAAHLPGGLAVRAQFRFQGRRRHESVTAFIVDDLRVDLFHASKNRQTRPFGQTLDSPSYPAVPDPAGPPVKPSLTQLRQCPRGGLSGLALDLFVGVLDSFARIGVGPPDATDLGSLFTNRLFVDPFDHNPVIAHDA